MKLRGWMRRRGSMSPGGSMGRDGAVAAVLGAGLPRSLHLEREGRGRAAGGAAAAGRSCGPPRRRSGTSAEAGRGLRPNPPSGCGRWVGRGGGQRSPPARSALPPGGCRGPEASPAPCPSRRGRAGGARPGAAAPRPGAAAGVLREKPPHPPRVVRPPLPVVALGGQEEPVLPPAREGKPPAGPCTPLPGFGGFPRLPGGLF